MGKRKQQYRPKDFESAEPNKPISANIYLDMLLSDAWKDLPTAAKELYIAMKSQYYGQKPIKLTDEITGEVTELPQEYFYFNRGLARDVFGMKNPNQVSKNTKALIQYGFIEIAVKAKKAPQKDIYKLSSKWREYGKSK